MFIISQYSIFNILKSILKEELKKLRNYELDNIDINFDTSLTQKGLELDSIELLNIVSTVNQVFCLYESNTEEYLLRYKKVKDWVLIIYESIKKSFKHMSFYTSGTTGNKKICKHPIENLLQEVECIKHLLGDIKKILFNVPQNHLYGFILTVLMPDYFNIEIIDISKLSISKTLNILDNDDLIVSFPTYWRYLTQSIDKFPSNKKILGVSSTAPLDKRITENLINQGLSKIFEIYGSSETSGVAYRKYPDNDYKLFSYWKKRHNRNDVIIRNTKSNEEIPYELSDNIEWVSERNFILLGRKDNVVQIGGVNVSLDKVRLIVNKHPLIKDSKIRIMDIEGENRLKAYIILKDNIIPNDTTKKDIEKWILNNLTAIERPKHITFGKTLPKNELDKPSDW